MTAKHANYHASKTNKMMPGDENDNDDKSAQDMSEADMLAERMDLMSQEGISDSKLRKILAYVERVVSGDVGRWRIMSAPYR